MSRPYPRPYHIQFPDYEERMRIITKNTLSWFRVAEQTPLFTLVPISHH